MIARNDVYGPDARGAAAHGVFESYGTGRSVTKAGFLAVGLHRSQESRLPGHHVCRRADRARHRQHHAGPTLEAFADHGQVGGDTITGSYDAARHFLDQLAAAGVDFDDVTEHLEHEGLAKFEKSWASWARPSQPRWTAAHLLGGGPLLAHRDRVGRQPGVGANTAVKTALTVAAPGTTAYSGLLGAKLGRAADVKTEGGTVPAEVTPDDVAQTQQRLRILQWITPVFTGALVGALPYGRSCGIRR